MSLSKISQIRAPTLKTLKISQSPKINLTYGTQTI